MYAYCVATGDGAFCIKSESREKLIKADFFLSFLFIQEMCKIRMSPF